MRWNAMMVLLVAAPAWAQADGETTTRAKSPAVPGEPAAAEEPAEEPIEELDVAEVRAVEASADWYSSAYPQFDRAFNLLTARPTRKGAVMAIIAHRTEQTFRLNTFRDWAGFDAGQLKIGLGVRYGLLDGLDIGVYRLNGALEIFDTYEFDARCQLLEQGKHGIDLALRAGASWFYQPEIEDGSGLFAQLLVSRVIAERLMLGTGLLYHSESSGDIKSAADDDFSVAVMALAEYRISDWWAVAYETSATVVGYGTDLRLTHTFGPKIVTNRHTFAVVVSNTQYMAADGMVANTRRGIKNLILGFNITREI